MTSHTLTVANKWMPFVCRTFWLLCHGEK